MPGIGHHIGLMQSPANFGNSQNKEAPQKKKHMVMIFEDLRVSTQPINLHRFTCFSEASVEKISGTFTNSCPTTQVATLRALAAITPAAPAFMNTMVAEDAFIRNHDCIRGVYQANSAGKAETPHNPHHGKNFKVPPGGPTDHQVRGDGINASPLTNIPGVTEFISAYNSWVKTIVQGIQPAVVAEMDRLILLFSGDANTNVKLSTNAILSTWAKLDPPVPASMPWQPANNLNTATGNIVGIKAVTMADLTTLRNSVPAISWANSLP
ncbi:hypothetical protein FB45DRAFT_862956 [Roridomyces roridus]|uniref:Uncharacterized protein n=1 Tax=Roridomyces roridus TaxID=1738132 RepID=A0AAD7CAF8_9AGAR|nr:hypothetical protein FB45DRAFT_862956 [Roridomyces roridus]